MLKAYLKQVFGPAFLAFLACCVPGFPCQGDEHELDRPGVDQGVEPVVALVWQMVLNVVESSEVLKVVS